MDLYYGLCIYKLFLIILHQSVVSEAVDDTDQYILIKEYTRMTMAFNFKIRQIDKNRRV